MNFIVVCESQSVGMKIMQPISYGPQQYPMYANCFDRLTTNGIIADDVVGYVTGTPSPYLQNYVAQRGFVPTMPGQIMPDALPTLPPQMPMSVAGMAPNMSQQTAPTTGSIYKDIPRDIGVDTLKPKSKNETIKKIVAGVLIGGLAAFGIYKGVNLFKNGGVGFKAAMTNFWNSLKSGCSTIGSKILSSLKSAWTYCIGACKSGFQKIGNFIKNLWNKMTHRTP